MGLRGPSAKPLKARREALEAATSRSYPWDAPGLSRADRVITFLEDLEITTGKHASTKLRLRPWQRKFLGNSVTANRVPRLKVAPESVKRLREKLRQVFRRGRGRRLDRVIQELNPVIRGWVAYFRMSDVRVSFEDLDGWLRRKLRCILWRQWKRPWTRRARLMARGLSEEQASHSAYNGYGPWRNAGASHMHQAIPTRYLRTHGLLSFLEEHRRLLCSS
jgi:hypothetical protein